MMERLTFRDADGRSHLTIHGAKMFCSTQATADYIAKLEETLTAYEVTGLEPEEAKAKCAWADNACKLLDGVFGGSGVFDFTHIKELLTAEAEGRLLILPCRVGDTVFAIKDRRIYIVDVIGFRVHDWTGLYVLLLFDSRIKNGSYEFRIEEFGKTVFLSREEAEAALRKESVV